MYGQNAELSNLRFKVISSRIDSLQIDTFSIVPGSFHIVGIDTPDYYVDYFAGKLYWKNLSKQDSVVIQYRTFGFSFLKPYTHKDVRAIESNYLITPYYYDATEAAKSNDKVFIDFGSVDYAGSFGRALSFGNSQDVVLNSQFNLQLDGDLGDSIRLTGAITDNTIPFQPEGNTQQLQEFDKVFIQLSRKRSSLIVGDYDIKRPDGYFMNFYKRVQGGMINSSFRTGKQGENKVAIGASLAKGKFVRNAIIALEGNQGPYKLTGPNGEQFFVVLAGTERVYIDGQLQSRGEGQDYIIDYNTAEVTFMPRRIITKDLRITVEFEFSDRNYLNSLIYFQNDWKVNKDLQLRFNIYSNQDAKNQPIQLSLDSAQKSYLAGIGDSIGLALYPSVRYEDTFSNNKILYKRIDTIVNGFLYQNIYVFSSNPDSAKYSLAFTYVGIGKGNYKQSINSANGRVYEWIAPLSGSLQGEYEPVQVLVTPKKQQMLTVGATYQLDSAKVLSVEGAVTNYDPNLFSSIHNTTHTGLAAKLNYEEARTLSSSKGLTLSSKINYEYVQGRFKPIERFRNVEFARDWNMGANELAANELLGYFSTALSKKEWGNLEYKFGNYMRGTNFRGIQHITSLNVLRNGYKLLVKGDWIKQNNSLTKGTFFRPSAEIEKQFSFLHNFSIGTKFLMENNAHKDAQMDTLLHNAFSFDALSFYLKNSTNSDKHFNLEYTLRHDRGVKKNEFKPSTVGHTFSLNTAITSIKNHDIKLTSAYRILNIRDSSLTVFKPDESLLGRLEYTFTLWKGLISGNMLYEMGSGQEVKREFTYVQVPAGQGVYVWRDYNQDNLKQLNEFEVAIFPDEKLYIRVFTPTNQYVKAKYSVYNQSISISPKAIWGDIKRFGFKKLATSIYLQSAVQLNNRFVGKNGIAQYNPFMNVFEDSLLINNNSSFINSMFINRFSNKWGIDYIHTLNGGRTLLNYGVDTRQNTEHQIRGRYNLSQNITLNASIKKGYRSFKSQFLESRTYFINTKSMEPGITILFFKNQFRIQSGYKFDERKNKQIYGNELATLHSLNLDMKYNILSSGSINVKGTFANIHFNGVANSTIGYTMLDGLQAGKNWLWGANFEKRLSRNIEMSLEYEGRKPGSSNPVHTGRASVRAIF